MGDGKFIRLFDLRSRKFADYPGHEANITSLAFSPDGSRLVSGSEDTTALIWDVAQLLAGLPKADAVEDPSKADGF